jgi:dTDP-4-dehydrorhamnose 3,5-epimerase
VKVERGAFDGLLLVTLDVYRDHRGFFVERYNEATFRQHRIPTSFCQDNHSHSVPGTLRGLHYQTSPPQGKLVGVVRGRIWDVVVDLRPQSSTYGQHLATELSGEGGQLLWIPAGFAHGFCVLGDEPAEVLYKVDAPYDPAGEGGILWSDPDLAIAWPTPDPIVSAKDRQLASFAQYREAPYSFSFIS